ncbi:hypothetical protein C0Q70_06297 [Pomacea canaliculata]|uniref:LIM zinc-binding domain-containing protein n=1 Tax=Pomacea canaliculata TaxID=400727 RepID=A0A2T7PNL2_POMCA|nr:hypothetical protein C0Q70_06297 [Pomacea canaliculata]
MTSQDASASEARLSPQRALARVHYDMHFSQERYDAERDVAVTIYWLGRASSQQYSGPKLDQSAFAALVHRGSSFLTDRQVLRGSSCARESNGHFSASASMRDTVDPRAKHVRDSSYDSNNSYGKASEDSLEGLVFDTDINGMPISRYDSASALNRSGEGSSRRSGVSTSMYGYDKGSAMYRSSPDLSSSMSNRRSSSVDSADGSMYGSHSRQSSDSTESHPSRRLSTHTSSRRTSTSASTDPLQFVKCKGATVLAITAEQQMRLAAETKKSVVVPLKEEDTSDWQSNLASWKNRRKSQSEKSYGLKEALEQMEREKEETNNGQKSTVGTKTYSQMKEERERRKSAGSKRFYPIEDDDEEDDIFEPIVAEKEENSYMQKTNEHSEASWESGSKQASQVSGMANWTEDSDSGEDDKKTKQSGDRNNNRYESSTRASDSRFSGVSNESAPSRSDVSSRLHHSGLSGQSATYSNNSETVKRRGGSGESVAKENDRNSANASLTKSMGRLSNLAKSYEQMEDTAKPKSRAQHSVDVNTKSFQKSVDQDGSKSVDSYQFSRSADDNRMSSWSTPKDRETKHSAGNVYASGRNSGKDYVEKNIKISQKPNNEKGFGFSLSGGADKKQAVVVEKIVLGSAADVCELQTKDEVVSINGQSIAQLTSAELEQKVKNAVSVGQIELRVKRYLGSRGDEIEEDEFFSSDEEVSIPDQNISKSSGRPENSFDSLDSREDTEKFEGTSITSQLEKERKWLEAQIENAVPILTQSKRREDPAQTSSDSGYDAQTFPQQPYKGDSSSNLDETPTQEAVQYSVQLEQHALPKEKEQSDDVVVQVRPRIRERGRLEKQGGAMPSEEVTVEMRSTITANKKVADDSHLKDSKDDRSSIASLEASSESTSVNSHKNQDSDGSGSGFQPPAVLRKWQRQRVREEYMFESDDSPQIYNQIKFSSTMPQPSSERQLVEDGQVRKDDMILNKASASYSAALQSQPPLAAPRHTFNLSSERQKMQEWEQRQEDERQPVTVSTSQSDNAVELQFHVDKEQQLLDPEIEKMRKLEERRAQRRARLMDVADTSLASPPRPVENILEPSYQVQEQHSAPQSHMSTVSMQLPGRNIGQKPGILIIDPRNCGEDTSPPLEAGLPGQPYQIQLKINQMDTPHGLLVSTQPIVLAPTDPKAFLEAERERIRQEELQKIEEERRRREDEDSKRLRSKEEELRRQEEMLKQQQERLKQEQERLERERRQLQQQQIKPATFVQEPNVLPTSSLAVHAEPPLKFETVSSRSRGESPTYTSSVKPGTRRLEGQPQGFSASSSLDKGRESSGTYHTQKSDSLQNSKSISVSTSPARRSDHQPATASQSSLPRWPPSSQNAERKSSPLPRDSTSQQLSREDMVAMNRKATPLQTKPLSPTDSVSSDKLSTAKPVRREAPSKGQIHSLNSVPRAKFRSSNEWIGSSKEEEDNPPALLDYSSGGDRGQQPTASSHQSEMYRKQFASPQDHWLVQEAERRRIHETSERQGASRSQHSGPIKPAMDRLDNRWRDESLDQPASSSMPAQIRQTLLQKTAGARGSNSNNYPQDPNFVSQSHHQPAYTLPNSMSQTLPANFGYSSGPRSEMVPPAHRPPSPESYRDNGNEISGKQRCSHCTQELGFGAAMVIESLGLYYHVQCFRCYVCHTPLGSGNQGADVRVRVNKLHCPNCYSNDEAGLKFSKFTIALEF